MLTGYIQDDKPIIPISVCVDQQVETIPALVDTGFTGELKMPAEIAAPLGIATQAVKNIVFGNFESMSHGIGRADIAMEGLRKDVEVLVGRGPTIIGVKLLRKFGYTLKMDFVGNIFYLERIEDRDPFNTEE